MFHGPSHNSVKPKLVDSHICFMILSYVSFGSHFVPLNPKGLCCLKRHNTLHCHCSYGQGFVLFGGSGLTAQWIPSDNGLVSLYSDCERKRWV